MTLKQVSAKIDARLNKSASGDYDSIWSYVKQEAFNKAITDSIRRMKRGTNHLLDGDEESVTRVDDLQVLLKTENLTIRNKGIYVQTSVLPKDYDSFKRLTPTVSKGSCSSVLIKSHLREEANVDNLLTFPSFDFEETFHTLKGNRANVYHNNDFTVDKVSLTYYKKPKFYDFKKLETEVEFQESTCELFVDEACRIISSDIESLHAKAFAQERKEDND